MVMLMLIVVLMLVRNRVSLEYCTLGLNEWLIGFLKKRKELAIQETNSKSV